MTQLARRWETGADNLEHAIADGASRHPSEVETLRGCAYELRSTLRARRPGAQSAGAGPTPDVDPAEHVVAGDPALLHWSFAWAEVVGADGPTITDLLGRVIPTLTTEQRGDLRRIRQSEGRTVRGLDAAWAVADANGLRTALACALRSGDRALRTHITGPTGPDIDDVIRCVLAALVVRRHHAPAVQLTDAWEQVLGDLPTIDGLVEADRGPEYCLACNRPVGARYVTEAEAARYARHLHGMNVDGARIAAREASEARRNLAHRLQDYIRPAELQEALDACLDWPGVTVPPKVRRHIEDQIARRFPQMSEVS